MKRRIRDRCCWTALVATTAALHLIAGCGDPTPAETLPTGTDGTPQGPAPSPGATTPDPGSPFAPPSPQALGSACAATPPQLLHEDAAGESAWMPRIAASDQRLGVAFTQIVDTSRLAGEVYFATLDAQGKPLGPAMALSSSGAVRTHEAPAVTGLGGGFAVAWGDRRDLAQATDEGDIYLARVGNDGQRAGQELQLTHNGRASHPALAAPALVGTLGINSVDSVAIAWRDASAYTPSSGMPYDQGSGRYNINLKVVDLAGTERVPVTVVTTSSPATRSSMPRLAFDGNGFALLYADMSSMMSKLYLSRLGLAGQLLLGDRLVATTSGIGSIASDMAWTGAEAAVVYASKSSSAGGGIELVRVNQASPSTPTSVSNAGLPCTPAVGFNGQHYGVVWQDQCGKQGSKLLFALVDQSGQRLRGDGSACPLADDTCGVLPLSPGVGGTPAFPDMTVVAGRFALTWMNAPLSRIYATQVSCAAVVP